MQKVIITDMSNVCKKKKKKIDANFIPVVIDKISIVQELLKISHTGIQKFDFC